jgi:glycosyltransferase involved in cell wall biosynthesis
LAGNVHAVRDGSVDLPTRFPAEWNVRILLINQAFYPDPQATSQYLSRLAEELAKRGHEVIVLTGRRDYDKPDRQFAARETWRGVTIFRVWTAGLGHSSKWSYAVEFLTFFLAAAQRGLLLPKADLVVTQTSPFLISILGVVLARVWRARFIYWVMDLNPDEAIAVGWLAAGSPMARFLEAASRWSLRQADRVIVNDKYVKERLLAKGIAGGKIDPVPLWIQDEAAFNAGKREEFRRLHGLEQKYVVMFAGNHTPCHPLDTLVEAARILRSELRVHFCFIGFGLEWGRWREISRKEKWENATFLGHQPLSSGVISAADTQVIVMGDAFVGIIHACKIYNFLAARRPFVYIGPEPSHVTDIIRRGHLEGVAASFRHGHGAELAEEILARARRSADPAWPAGENLALWSEEAVVGRMVSILQSHVPTEDPRWQ